MGLFQSIAFFLKITRSRGIARRYFVVNGFDGALTILGLIMGFYISETVDIAVVVSACMGASIALAMSGISSAYISESAEKKRELRDLESAMISELSGSVHARASRVVPWMVALINGFSPLFFALIITLPLMLAEGGVDLPIAPLTLSILLAFFTVFMLGVFLGRISGVFWLWSGIQALLIAIMTAMLILWLGE